MLHLKDHQPDITLSAGRPKSSCKRRHNHIWCLSGGCPAGCTLPFPSPRGETRFFGEPLQKIDTSKLAAQNGKKKKGREKEGIRPPAATLWPSTALGLDLPLARLEIWSQPRPTCEVGKWNSSGSSKRARTNPAPLFQSDLAQSPLYTNQPTPLHRVSQHRNTINSSAG